jgi:hypothetical protein
LAADQSKGSYEEILSPIFQEYVSSLVSHALQPSSWIVIQLMITALPYRCHRCLLSVNYGAPQAIGGDLMFDFHHDWKAWSDKERTTVAALAAGLAMIVVAWMVV